MKKGMLTKILTALILVAIVIPPFCLGGIPLKILELAAIFIASYEISSLVDQKAHWLMTVLMTIFISALIYFPSNYYLFGMSIYLTILFVYLLINEKYSIDELVYQFVIVFILTQALLAIDKIYTNQLGFTVMIYVALATYLCDTGAYFFGVFFGKHKFIPRVSPNKTWEGAIGGYFTGAFVSFIFALFLCKQLPLQFILLSSLILPVIAEVGDLAFSSIKRRFHIKDFGSFLPGHGGALDRIDSLLFCLMIFHALLIFWGF